MPRERDDAPWTAGHVRVRKVRGPHRDDPACFYWRAYIPQGGKEPIVWKGWARRNDPDIVREILEAVRQLGDNPAGVLRGTALPGDQLLHLLGAWKAEQRRRRDAHELAVSSFEQYERNLRHLSRLLAEVAIDRFDGDAVRDYRRQRLAEKAAGRTVAQEMTILAMAWKWGRRRGLVPDVDVEWPDFPKATTVRNRYTPTAAEVLATIEKARFPWVRIALVLLYATGGRIGEVQDLRWEAIDLERGTIILSGKTGPREIPLSSDALRELRAVAGDAPDPDGRVIPTEIAHVRSSLHAEIRIACAGAGLRRSWSPHALRRLATDTLYDGRTDVGAAAALLGHSPLVALRHYRRPKPDTLKRAIEAAGLGRIPEGRVVNLKVAVPMAPPEDGSRHNRPSQVDEEDDE
jgi:integrase